MTERRMLSLQDLGGIFWPIWGTDGGWGWGKWKNCLYGSFDEGLWDFTEAGKRLNGEWRFGWYFWPFWGSDGGPQGRKCVI